MAVPKRTPQEYGNVQEWSDQETEKGDRDGNRESTERAFEAYGGQLEAVDSFKDLGRVMTAGDDDWPAVAGNLKKARRIWGRLSRILTREGATARISGMFFKSVIQQILLFGDETWVVTPRMEKALSGFIYGAARRLTGRQARKGINGKW